MTAPACPPDADLRALLEGTLAPATLSALDEHVAGCPACEKRLGRIVPDGAGFLVLQAYLDSDDRGLSHLLEPLPDVPGVLGAFGKYRIEAELGRGGMGVVYRAIDTNLQRPVALKVMLNRANASRSARTRFLQEARAAAAIRSEHVVHIHEADEIAGTPYIAFELLDGRSLESLVTEQGSLPVAEVVRILRHAARGLETAHRLGFLHRDVKPSNLWIQEPTRTVKILDFGLARQEHADARLTASGAILGSPGYMPPEQARGETADARGDLFSLGATAYRMLTGSLPFPGKSPLAILTALAQQEPIPIRHLRPDCPPGLATLVHRLLAKDPDGRPQSAAEVLRELDELFPTDPTVTVPVAARPPRRRLWQALAGVAVAVLLAVGIGVALSGRTPTDPSAAHLPQQPSPIPPVAPGPFSLSQLPLLPVDKRKPWYPPETVAVIGADGGYFGHPAESLPPVFTPDGKYLISRTGHAVDTDTGELLPPPGHPSVRKGKPPIAFHPTTGWALYASGDVIDWDDPKRPVVAKYGEIAEFGSDDVFALFSKNGMWLYAASGPTAVLCDLPTPNECRRQALFEKNGLPSAAGHFSPDGRWFVSARGAGRQVEVIELDGPKQVIARDVPVRDGRKAVAVRVDDDGRVFLVDDQRGRELHAPDGAKTKLLDHEEQAELFAAPLAPLVPLPGGGYLVGGETATQVIRTGGGKLRPEAVMPHPEYHLSGLTHLLAHPNGRSVYAVTAVGFLDRYPLPAAGGDVRFTPALRFRTQFPANQPLVVSNDGRYLFAKADNDRLRAYEFQTGQLIAFAPQTGAERISDVPMFAAGTDGCMVRENDWTAKVYRPGQPPELAAVPRDCRPLVANADLTTFLGVDREGGGYRLRRPNDPPQGIDLGGRGDFADLARLSPDATRLVVAPVGYRGYVGDFNVRTIDLTTPQPTVKAFPIQAPGAAAIHPNGRRVAIGRDNQPIKYFELTDGRKADDPEVVSPVVEVAAVAWLDYSPDGERLLVTSRHRDGSSTVAVHACDSGRTQYSWAAPHAMHATHAKFTADGGHILVNTCTGGVWLLRLPG